MAVEVRTETKKFLIGEYKVPVVLSYKASRIFVSFGFNRKLIDEVKQMEGAKWHGYDDPNPQKIWSIADSPRNSFRIAHLSCENPYKRYDAKLIEFTPSRTLYDHQKVMTSHWLTRHYAIFAAEMGCGKSLSFIEGLDHIEGLRDEDIVYVGPKSGVIAVKREFIKWRSKFKPQFFTYQAFMSAVEKWDEPVPRVICFDESSRIKTPTAKRSQAALHMSNQVRIEHGEDGYILEMSGTPAPKAPTDWWHQAEVACPGYIREGNLAKFKARLCIVENRQSITGGVYPHLVSWLDDETKCAKCGKLKIDFAHESFSPEFVHEFVASKNEVAYLRERMKDLALVLFKKDCLDLPEKQYQTIVVKPTVETLRAAKLIRKVHARAVTCLTLLRELSDGFQYREMPTGEKEPCPTCHGTKTYKGLMPRVDVNPMAPQDIKAEDFIEADIACTICDQNGMVDKLERATIEIETPKDEALIELLEDHEDLGRFVIWGGFTATLDRLVSICHKYGWATLRIDGQGYVATTAIDEPVDYNDFLDAMDATNPRRQELLDKYPKVVVVGQPRTGGMALTFTMSPTALFYSNDFDGEARMQAEDRIHRIGMSINRGALIIDLIHLPTDQIVIDNLKKKKKLQYLTMGEVEAVFQERLS